VVVAAFGAVYWERIADQDTVIRTELDGCATIPTTKVSLTAEDHDG
jgi:hypothetical protein